MMDTDLGGGGGDADMIWAAAGRESGQIARPVSLSKSCDAMAACTTVDTEKAIRSLVRFPSAKVVQAT